MAMFQILVDNELVALISGVQLENSLLMNSKVKCFSLLKVPQILSYAILSCFILLRDTKKSRKKHKIS